MKKEYGNYNHLCRIPNTEENMTMIKTLRKLMKLSESRWQLVLRGRHPIEGKNYGYGGSLALKYAKSVSIYVVPRKSVKEAENIQRHKMLSEGWRNKMAIEKISQVLKQHNSRYND
tara:strand:+ start:939 stop:1286 length:348 start_codon:yes stop_codon:yes gene_type:complete